MVNIRVVLVTLGMIAKEVVIRIVNHPSTYLESVKTYEQ